jgi:hypothetical protein
MPSSALTRRCALGLAAAVVTSPVAAQDTAAAGALFEKGVSDMEAGKFESGCPAIEESQRLDPRPGTLFTLAECNAGWGKLASAAAQYQEYVDLVSRLTRAQQLRHQVRVDISHEQLAALKPQVPLLTLVLPPDAPSGTFVTRNGEVLKGAALGLPLPVDPGSYRIITHVPGGSERETHVELQRGDAKRLELEVALPTSAGKPVEAPQEHSVAVLASPASAPQSSGNTASFVALGVGLTGVLVGSVSGALVFSKKHVVTENCAGKSCNNTGLSAAESAQNLALISDVGFGVGVAGLAVGTILWLSSGSSGKPREHATRLEPLLTAGRDGVTAGISRRW